MGRIPDHVIDQVRERADIVQIVGRHVALKRSGARWWGLCPFHDEKSPSFQVSEEKQVFYCFGCQAGGDVFGFKMRHDGLDFPDAIRSLAREVGVEIPESHDGPDGRRGRDLYEVNDAAAEFFKRALRSREGEAARAYLAERGVPQDLCERFGVGWALDRWDGLAERVERKGLLDTATAAGLTAPRQNGGGFYDRFRARIIFPIGEPSGHIVGFGGRALGDDTPKYLNTPETPVYHKSRVLFGLPQALEAIRDRERVILVEGYFDVVALHRAGLSEVVAPCGTALTRDHAKRLRRYTRDVILLFDGDSAGQTAAERALPTLLDAGLRVRGAFLPPGEDPDDLLSRSGPAGLRACVDASVPLIDHLIERAVKRMSDDAWDASEASHAVEPYLAAIQDPVERAAYTRKLASYLELPPDAISASVKRTAEMAAPRARPAVEAVGVDVPSKRARPVRVHPTVGSLLADLCARPIAALPALEALDWSWVIDPDGRELLDALAEAIPTYGDATTANLLSPGNDTLSDEFKAELSRIVATSVVGNDAAALQAACDCVRKLGLEFYTQRRKEINRRSETCTDPEEQDRLVAEAQQYTALIRTLSAPVPR